jgi:hypothetical protein
LQEIHSGFFRAFGAEDAYAIQHEGLNKYVMRFFALQKGHFSGRVYAFMLSTWPDAVDTANLRPTLLSDMLLKGFARGHI